MKQDGNNLQTEFVQMFPRQISALVWTILIRCNGPDLLLISVSCCCLFSAILLIIGFVYSLQYWANFSSLCSESQTDITGRYWIVWKIEYWKACQPQANQTMAASFLIASWGETYLWTRMLFQNLSVTFKNIN